MSYILFFEKWWFGNEFSSTDIEEKNQNFYIFRITLSKTQSHIQCPKGNNYLSLLILRLVITNKWSFFSLFLWFLSPSFLITRFSWRVFVRLYSLHAETFALKLLHPAPIHVSHRNPPEQMANVARKFAEKWHSATTDSEQCQEKVTKRGR